MSEKYIRLCPNCKKEVIHINKVSYQKSIDKNLLCRSCVMAGNTRMPLGINEDLRYPKEDLVGSIFNHYEVLSLSHRGDDKNGKGIWYWNVKCLNCSTVVKRITSYLKKSKGCIICKLLPKGTTGLNKVFGSYRDSSKIRGMTFDLDKDQFRQLTSSRCYYCGCLPTMKKLRKYKDDRSSWGDYAYNGIDRIDNNKGYIFNNCVACCRPCNRGKGAWSFGFWLSHLQQFANNVLNGDVPCLKEENKIAFTEVINENSKKIF